MFKSFRSPKTIIKTSAKGGKGLFATENILANEIIGIRARHNVLLYLPGNQRRKNS
jgi:hypothetical protein